MKDFWRKKWAKVIFQYVDKVKEHLFNINDVNISSIISKQYKMATSYGLRIEKLLQNYLHKH